MKKDTTVLLVVVTIVLIIVIGYILVKVINSERMKVNTKQQMIGIWTTENGAVKLIINKGSLVYTSESYNIEDTSTYVIKYFDGQEDEFALYPTEDNEIQILGAFEEIRYRGGSLFGSILIHDEGVNITEFRKEW